MANISTNLKNFITLFEFLTTIKEKRLQLKLLKQLSTSDKFNQAVREIAFNLVNGKIKLTNSQKRTLRPFGKVIEQLSHASSCKKRQVSVQRGRGLFPLLIPIALTAINELIN